MKHRILFITLSIIMLLCACITSFADDTVNITFWHGYNEDNGEADLLINTLIPQFEAEHPNIKVTAVSVPYDSFLTKLIAAISAGSAPDLFRSDIIWVPQLAEQGALLSLDENMPDFEEYKAAVFEGPLSTNYWKGHYYGLPLDTNTKVWLSNSAMYEKAGVSVPEKMSELEDTCKAIKAADPNAYLFSADGFYAWNLLPFIWSFGGGITDEEVTTADGYINSPQTVAAYEFIMKLYDEGCISPLIMGDGVDNYSGFAGGLYADISDGPWAYSILNGQFPDFTFEASLFPEGEGGSIQVIGGEDINIIAQTQHKDEAMEFMRFLVSKDYQISMMSVGQMPVRNDLAESEEVKNHPYFGIFLEQIATSKARNAAKLFFCKVFKGYFPLPPLALSRRYWKAKSSGFFYSVLPKSIESRICHHLSFLLNVITAWHIKPNTREKQPPPNSDAPHPAPDIVIKPPTKKIPMPRNIPTP